MKGLEVSPYLFEGYFIFSFEYDLVQHPEHKYPRFLVKFLPNGDILFENISMNEDTNYG